MNVDNIVDSKTIECVAIQSVQSVSNDLSSIVESIVCKFISKSGVKCKLECFEDGLCKMHKHQSTIQKKDVSEAIPSKPPKADKISNKEIVRCSFVDSNLEQCTKNCPPKQTTCTFHLKKSLHEKITSSIVKSICKYKTKDGMACTIESCDNLGFCIRHKAIIEEKKAKSISSNQSQDATVKLLLEATKQIATITALCQDLMINSSKQNIAPTLPIALPLKKVITKPLVADELRCTFITKSGKQCNLIKGESGLCKMHEHQTNKNKVTSNVEIVTEA